jgi:hypothetical protein
VVCPICGEKRKYLPAEVLHGRPHSALLLKRRMNERKPPSSIGLCKQVQATH